MLAVYRKFAVLYINVHVHVQQVWYKYELSTNQKPSDTDFEAGRGPVSKVRNTSIRNRHSIVTSPFSTRIRKIRSAPSFRDISDLSGPAQIPIIVFYEPD